MTLIICRIGGCGMQNTVKTNIFPCKSINLLRFIKAKGIRSEHKYTDALDGKDCWIFLRTKELENTLTEYGKIRNSNLT